MSTRIKPKPTSPATLNCDHGSWKQSSQHPRTIYSHTCFCCFLNAFPALGLIVSLSPGLYKVVTSVVASSSPLHSLSDRLKLLKVWLLTEPLWIAVAPSISMSVVELQWPLLIAVQSGSIVIFDFMMITHELLPISEACKFGHAASWPRYRCTIISVLWTSAWPLTIHKEVNQPVVQLIPCQLLLNLGNHSSLRCALSRMCPQ